MCVPTSLKEPTVTPSAWALAKRSNLPFSVFRSSIAEPRHHRRCEAYLTYGAASCEESTDTNVPSRTSAGTKYTGTPSRPKQMGMPSDLNVETRRLLLSAQALRLRGGPVSSVPSRSLSIFRILCFWRLPISYSAILSAQLGPTLVLPVICRARI
jgi:hypothetical protein